MCRQQPNQWFFFAFATVLTLTISPFIGGISFRGIETVWLTALVMVLSVTFGNVVYYKGMKTLDASTSQIGFSSILIWGTLFSALFLDSRFTLQQIIGILLLMFTIIWVQYQKNIRKVDIGIVYIVISAGLFAVFQVASAELAKTMSAGGYLLLGNLGPGLITAIIYSSVIRHELSKLKNRLGSTIKIMLFASSTSLMYWAFAYYAYKYAPDRGVVVILLTSQVILAVILGIIFLKERKRIKRKLSAGVLALIAGILIKS